VSSRAGPAPPWLELSSDVFIRTPRSGLEWIKATIDRVHGLQARARYTGDDSDVQYWYHANEGLIKPRRG